MAFTAGDTLEALPPEHAPASSKPARHPRLPEHLPVVEEFIDPAEVLADPGAFRRIGEERTAQLDYTPGRFFQRHTVRRKYIRKNDRDTVPVIAPLTILQDRCLAAPALLARIIVSKYCDHLPLYRLEQIFKTRNSVLLPRQSKPLGGAEIASRQAARRAKEPGATEANHGPLAGHDRLLAERRLP